jgi:hypothetical protein
MLGGFKAEWVEGLEVGIIIPFKHPSLLASQSQAFLV